MDPFHTSCEWKRVDDEDEYADDGATEAGSMGPKAEEECAGEIEEDIPNLVSDLNLD